MKRGCKQLALLDLNENGLATSKRVVEEVVGSATKRITLIIRTYKCDVSSEESVATAYATAKQDFGRIDYSVHCAGIVSVGKTSPEMSVEEFDKQSNINFRGLWLSSREALRHMSSQTLDSEAYPEEGILSTRGQRGSIVNISSSLALYTQPNTTVYTAVKAAVLGITRSDAVDYANDRIRVNAVLPGIIESPMTTATPELKEWMQGNPVQHTPYKRFGLPEEIADVIVFLSGNRASLVTGASWTADGGLTAGYN